MQAFVTALCPKFGCGEITPYYGPVTHYPDSWPWKCDTCSLTWRMPSDRTKWR